MKNCGPAHPLQHFDRSNNEAQISHLGRSINKIAADRVKSLSEKTGKSTQVTDSHAQEIARTEASRPVNAGTGKHRGDRRDMSPTYTNNEKHSARGNSPRKDVKTRAR